MSLFLSGVKGRGSAPQHTAASQCVVSNFEKKNLDLHGSSKLNFSPCEMNKGNFFLPLLSDKKLCEMTLDVMRFVPVQDVVNIFHWSACTHCGTLLPSCGCKL